MAENRQIQCINRTTRTDPHERIQFVGGVLSSGQRWKVSQPQAIAEIEAGRVNYFTSIAGKSVWVIVALHNGNKYIKTQNDGLHPNNLLALPDCP